MTLSREKLVNIALFMERVSDNSLLKGKLEVLAWSETYEGVMAEIKELDTPRPQGDAQ